MSKLSDDDVKNLAKLSRLALSDEEIEKFKTEITQILGYVEQLQSIDTEGVEPTSQVSGLTDVTRPDEVREYGPGQTELLKNLPAQKDGYIKVKKIL